MLVSIAFFALLWRCSYIVPHAGWAIASIVAVGGSASALAGCALWSVVFGPKRLTGIAWLLLGATPLVWFGSYCADVWVKMRNRSIDVSPPLVVTGIWAASLMDVEARWRFSRRTSGRHVVLIDDGGTQDVEMQIDAMDKHIEAMAALLGQPPRAPVHWVRGSLLGEKGRSILLWALCDPGDQRPSELTYLDRHESAHALITSLSGPDQDPPMLLAEGWAEFQSRHHDQQIRALARLRGQGSSYSLAELVGNEWYKRGEGPVYHHGGPLVHYLIDQYGGQRFFQFYSGVRQRSFLGDCQRILGVDWSEVETDFWNWLSAASRALQETPVDYFSSGKVKLLEGVNEADWREIVNGYLNANRNLGELPDESAFILEEIRREIPADATQAPTEQHSKTEVVLRGDNVWCRRQGRHLEEFLCGSAGFAAALHRDSDGRLVGWLDRNAKGNSIRSSIQDRLKSHANQADPAYLLPVDVSRLADGEFEIHKIERPTQANPIWTLHYVRKSNGWRCTIDLDSALQWWAPRTVFQWPDGGTREDRFVLDKCGTMMLPSQSHRETRYRSGAKIVTESLTRFLSDDEIQHVQRAVEDASRKGPADRRSRMEVVLSRSVRYLLLIAIVWPCIGFALIVIERRQQVSSPNGLI
jgi:hypothetical protein